MPPPICWERARPCEGLIDRRPRHSRHDNCRFVAGSGGVWSQHAYGRALDLNPLENPYVTESGYVSPPAGAPFADRSRHTKGLIHRGGPVVAAFAAVGWEWGGNWPWPKDFQHFSATGT